MQHNIRRPLFEGMREVHAIWFDIGLLGDAQARVRVLAHWQTGARLHLTGGGYLLMLVKPMMADCRKLDGLALCKVDGVLASAPLADDERHAVPPGACLLVRGAQVHAVATTKENEVDAGAWIDLSAIVVCTPLAPPAGEAFVDLAAPEQSKSLRSILGDTIKPPSAQREAFLRAAMAATGKKRPVSLGGVASAAGKTAAAGALTAVMGLAMMPLLLAKLFGARIGAGGSGSGGGSAGSTDHGSTGSQHHRPDPEWMQRLHAWMARLATVTKVSNVIGWRQAAYLRKMMAMLEDGDIAEALRHAIPLGGDSDSVRQALGGLQARASLEITAAGGTASAVYLDPSIQQYLRDSYRKLFQRLEREGRIDEATYVLAELLHSGVEAVDYLERQGRLRQAAQLADKLALAPEVSVRLWILAGDATRAVQVARASGAFGDAVRLLERKQDAQANGLRALWAEYLAERGDLTEAAEVIWPLDNYRSVALTWLTQAEQAGRTPGARALVRKLALLPYSLAASLATMTTMLDHPGDDGAALRRSLAIELMALDAQSDATRRLAHEVLRVVIADRSAGRNTLAKGDFTKLISIARPHMFKSDLPSIGFGSSPARLLGSAATPLLAQLDQRGQLPIHDARRLPDGHYLLALGEAGVVRINAKGKQIVHFPLPAHHLVLATNGERALALARRGDVVRASRIDLLSCKVSDWLSHPIDFWAPQFDGVVWNAVIANRLVAIDTTLDRLTIIWQVADLPGKVFDFHDDGKEQVILMQGAQGLQQWRYSLPARRMLQRDLIDIPDKDIVRVMGVPTCTVPAMVRVVGEGEDRSLHIALSHGALLKFVIGSPAAQPGIATQDGWVMVSSVGEDGLFICTVADKRMQKIVTELRIAQADGAGVCAHDRHILVFDRCGRLLDVDSQTSAVISLSLS
jgi:hypothetical protein